MLQQARSRSLRTKAVLRLNTSLAAPPISSSSAVSNYCVVQWSEQQRHQYTSSIIRKYTNSACLLSQKAATTKLEAIRNKKAAEEYNRQKALYKKQVSKLRKEYAQEVTAQRATDAAEKEAKRQELTRRRLERQRLKNIRSAQNAIRQKQIQEERHREWQEELRVAQIDRDARNERFRKARQLLVDELEEEAPLWLTTSEEVEKAFGNTAEIDQLLWARPHSLIGAPAPSEDAEFWKYETHTWHMDKTYPTRGELLVEKIQEKAFFKANVDEEYWTPERLAEREELEEKAKLRAMVRDEGRRILLHKQRELLQDDFTTKKKYDLPKAMPVPSTRVLTNTEAMEREGATVLLNDPTKFFEFEDDDASEIIGSTTKKNEGIDDNVYQGPTLGKPIGLKDPIRSPLNQGRPYPMVVGKLPKPDMRTEREKKREEREQAMLAAARGESSSGDKSKSEIEFEAEDSFDTDGESLDYDLVSQEYDSDDDEDREKEIDSVISKLEWEVTQLKEELRMDLETVQQELQAKRETGGGSGGEVGDVDTSVDVVKNDDDDNDDDVLDGSLGGKYVKNEGVDKEGKKFVQYERDEPPAHDGVGIDVDDDVTDARGVLSKLTEEQVVAVLSLAVDGLGKETMSKSEILNALQKVPGKLTEEQIVSIATLVEREHASQNEKFIKDDGEDDDNDDDDDK